MSAAKSSVSCGNAMSRIGRAPITIPSGVDVTIAGNNVAVKGPKGSCPWSVHPKMQVALDAGVMTVTRPDDSGPNRSLHGLTRTLLSNMVTGVTTGFEKKLEIQGVGYRASKKGSDLEILVGYSHPVVVPPAGEHRVRRARAHADRGQGHRQAARRPGGRRDPRPSGNPSPTRARASATRAKWCGAKSASGRSGKRTE